jgi:hypothetical protein
LQLIPELVKQYKRTAFKIVPIIFNCLSKLNSDDRALKYLDFIERYLPTISEKGFKGLLSIGLFFFSTTEAHNAKEFEKTCPPNSIERIEDAEKLIIKCGAVISNIPEEIRDKYFALCMMVASHSFGSAVFVAYDLPKKLRYLEVAVRDQYIDSFAQVVNKVGICAIGFCSGHLYRRFLRHSSSETRELVNIICEIASKYGPFAASEFIEGKKEPKRFLRLYYHDVISPIVMLILAILALVFFVWTQFIKK